MSNRAVRHWYGSMLSAKPQAKVQVESPLRSTRGSYQMPETIVRMAAAEYNAQGYGQSYERLQERGGLGVLEIVALLADRIDRLNPPAPLTEGETQ